MKRPYEHSAANLDINGANVMTQSQREFHNNNASPFRRIVRSGTDIAVWFGTNPISLREFIRYARSFRFWGFMAFLLTVGTFILCMVWSYNQTVDPTIQVGRRLFYSLLATEFIVIVMLLPGIVSHSLISERDHDTYPLLLTTPLSPGRIIGGKLVSTLGVMVLLIVSTFPLIGICVLRGGVSPGEMIGGSFYLVFSCFVVASFSIYNALNAKTTLNAILLTHLTLFLSLIVGGATLGFWLGILYSILGIFAQLTSVNNPLFNQAYMPKLWFWTFAVSGTIFASLLTFWFLRASRSRMRYVEPQTRPQWEMNRAPQFSIRQKASTDDGSEQKRSWWEFQDGSNPFLIRERLSYAALASCSGMSSWYVIILLCHVLFLLTPISEGKWVAVIVLLAVAQMAPAYAGPLFAREKEQNTWELMLTTICKARTVLNGKLMGAISQCFPRVGILYGLPFAVAYILFLFPYAFNAQVGQFFGLHQILFYAFVIAVQLLFLLLATTYFSIRMPRIGSAISAGYVIAGITYAIPYLANLTVQRFHLPIPEVYLLVFSPIYIISSIPSANDTTIQAWIWLSKLAVHITIYATASAAFYFTCLWQLKKQR